MERAKRRAEAGTRPVGVCRGRADLIQQNGCADIAEDLKDVNLDLYLVLFPLKIVPPVEVELPHRTRAGSTIRSGRSFSPKGS